ncbi:MAG: hypothetical protein BACD_02605 [Bacteroides rodentium]
MKTFHKIGKRPNGNRCAIFRISTDRGDQFLCTDTEPESEDFSVVEVDTNHFLEMWRNDTYAPHLDASQGNPATWVKDDKFHDAEAGFAHGESNPVPLALVTCAIRNEAKNIWKRRYFFFKEYAGQQIVKRVPYITFTNGITRTIWLLAYGAKCFPVICETKNADLLQLMAGLPDGKPQTLQKLIESSVRK